MTASLHTTLLQMSVQCFLLTGFWDGQGGIGQGAMIEAASNQDGAIVFPPQKSMVIPRRLSIAYTSGGHRADDTEGEGASSGHWRRGWCKCQVSSFGFSSHLL